MRARLLSLAVPLVLLGQCAPTGCGPTAPAPAGFNPGTYLVGSQVAPGQWIARDAQDCYWERLSGLGGTLDEIIENNFASGPQIVEIEPTDVAFRSGQGCGRWVANGPAPQVAAFGDGDWAVGVTVSPGRWASDASTSGCYWERASGYTHEFGEIIANFFGAGPTMVDIAPTDVRFTTHGCGTWTRIA